MTETQNIGSLLRSKREELGLSIEELSNLTRIRVDYIKAIENDDRKGVPSSYFDLFQRKYASQLNFKIEIDNNNRHPEKKKKKSYKEHKLSDTTDNKFFRILKDLILFIQINKRLSLIIFLFIIIFSMVKITNSIFSPDKTTEKNEAVVKIITIEGSTDDGLSFDIRDSILIEDDRIEFMTVKIDAIDSCYICYYSDTMTVKETFLLPGQNITLKAERIIESKIGNSIAASISYNNEKVLQEIQNNGNGSSIIRITPRYGAEKIKRSEKIQQYLKKNYGLE